MNIELALQVVLVIILKSMLLFHQKIAGSSRHVVFPVGNYVRHQKGACYCRETMEIKWSKEP